MENKNSEWTFKKTVIRIFAYLICGYFIWMGVDKLNNPPYKGTDLIKSIGGIIAACVYLCYDIGIWILKIKRTNN